MLNVRQASIRIITEHQAAVARVLQATQLIGYVRQVRALHLTVLHKVVLQEPIIHEVLALSRFQLMP